MRAVGLPLFILLSLGLNVAVGESAARPGFPSSEQSSQASTLDFLRSQYGPYVSIVSDQSWHQLDPEYAPGWDYSLCASSRHAMGERNYRLIAVCGTKTNAGHAQSGVVDLFVLREGGAKLSPVASRLGIEVGSYGEPGEVSTLQFGRELYGFQVQDGYYGQLDTNRAIYLTAGPRGIEEVANPLLLWRSGSSLDCRDRMGFESAEFTEAGIDLNYDVQIDRSHPAAAVWPMIIQVSGSYTCRHLSQHFVVPFLPDQWRYDLPEFLKQSPQDINPRLLAAAQPQSGWTTTDEFLKDRYGDDFYPTTNSSINLSHPDQVRGWPKRDTLKKQGLSLDDLEFIAFTDAFEIDGVRLVLVRVHGYSLETSGTRGQPMLIDFHLLRDDGLTLSEVDSKLGVVAANLIAASGSYQDQLGAKVRGAFYFEAAASSVIGHVLLIDLQGIHEAGEFPVIYSPQPSMQTYWEFEPIPDASAGVWPLQVTSVEENASAQAFSELIRFDSELKRYVLPAKLAEQLRKIREGSAP